MYDEDNKGLQKLVPKKKRGRKIMDQKANSVADIATVLRKVGTPEGDAIGLQGTAEGLEDASRVEVRWSNLLDAEFAETWSENVVHDKLDWSKNNRGLHDLSKAQVDRLKDGKQLIEQWRAMTPDEKVDLAVEKFGAAILEEKERPRREYEQKQAALKAEWCVNTNLSIPVGLFTDSCPGKLTVVLLESFLLRKRPRGKELQKSAYLRKKRPERPRKICEWPPCSSRRRNREQRKHSKKRNVLHTRQNKLLREQNGTSIRVWFFVVFAY